MRDIEYSYICSDKQTFIIIANIIHLNEKSLLILDIFHDKKIFIRLAKTVK